MINGIGTDIIEIARIKANIEKFGEKFLDKILTAREKNYCFSFNDPAPSIAGRFSAKEAVAKALGTGFGELLEFQDIEVINSPNGAPYVILSQKAAAKFGHPRLLLSISHCKTYAVAFAIAEPPP